jgi:hypothetical protein
MFKRRVLVVFLLIACVIALTSCPTKYERKMAGNFELIKMELSGKNVDIDEAFSEAGVVLTTGRKFSISIEFKNEYLDAPSTHAMIKESVKPDRLTDQQVRDIIANLKEGFYLKGNFSNSHGMPVFTPDGTSKKPSDYGFSRFEYDFVKDILFIGGNKYVVTKFEFQKIK